LTVTPLPARALIPWYGVTTCGALTCALPPPAVIAFCPAASPMTAIDRTDDATGSTGPAFLSSTLPCWATWVATAVCASEVTGVVMSPVGGVSNSPAANIAVRIRRTWVSMVAVVTWPAFTALVSAVP
jgi:hypothetical protein